MSTVVSNITSKYNNDKTRLMDILLDIQHECGFISDDAVLELTKILPLSKVEVEETITFYHFFSRKSRGQNTIYLNNSVVSMMMGAGKVQEAFEEAANIHFGHVTHDDKLGLFHTACIGMSDQEPAALINGKVFNRLTPAKAKRIVIEIMAGRDLEEIYSEQPYGGGRNQSPDLQSIVNNSLRKVGPLLQAKDFEGTSLKKAIELGSDEVIRQVTLSNVRGRGGAGFPAGLKWEFCRKSPETERYVFCNADEGEPGTFKDRVLLTEKPELLFEGMAIAGFAIGAQKGVLYLRYEYKYMLNYLNNILEAMRSKGILKNAASGHDFDIRIQLGAGAYVCGEESALIESAEGKRGEPRDRPPFPVESGYLNKPTVVNNVETLVSIPLILDKGAEWFKGLGTDGSAGTKILSVSGDCQFPGIYEIEWGASVAEILDLVGAQDVQAVQVAGPSGILIGPEQFGRKLSFDDIPTGGSFIVFNSKRDLIKDVVMNFMDFFIEESCGSCTTCRITPVLMLEKVKKMMNGHGVYGDIQELESWGLALKASRCGLGQTAGNPILTSFVNFKHLYAQTLQHDKDYDMGFDLEESIQESCQVVGREAVIH